MELKLGKMTTKEIAEWFGISYGAFRQKKTKEKRYKELEQYCKYTKQYGGINVEEIYRAVYIKDPSKYELVKVFVFKTWERNAPETVSRVAAKIFQQYGKEFEIGESSCERYARMARDELWGSPKERKGGKSGKSKYVWSKMYRGFNHDNAKNKYELLNKAERKIIHDIHVKYFGDSEEKVSIGYSKVAEGEWTAEEFQEFVCGDVTKDDFKDYISEICEEIGCDWLVRATYVEDNGILCYKIDLSTLPKEEWPNGQKYVIVETMGEKQEK